MLIPVKPEEFLWSFSSVSIPVSGWWFLPFCFSFPLLFQVRVYFRWRALQPPLLISSRLIRCARHRKLDRQRERLASVSHPSVHQGRFDSDSMAMPSSFHFSVTVAACITDGIFGKEGGRRNKPFIPQINQSLSYPSSLYRYLFCDGIGKMECREIKGKIVLFVSKDYLFCFADLFFIETYSRAGPVHV